MRSIFQLLASGAAAILAASTLASDQSSPGYTVKREHAPTGSNIRETFAWSKSIPLDRPYSRFTAEQKQSFKNLYEPMPEDDEPPFPEDGLVPVVKALSELATRHRLEGLVRLHVVVDPEGKAKAFRFIRMPDERTGHAVAYVFTQIKFKPARCSGQPCQMEFPFTTQLRLE